MRCDGNAKPEQCLIKVPGKIFNENVINFNFLLLIIFLVLCLHLLLCAINQLQLTANEPSSFLLLQYRALSLPYFTILQFWINLFHFTFFEIFAFFSSLACRLPWQQQIGSAAKTGRQIVAKAAHSKFCCFYLGFSRSALRFSLMLRMRTNTCAHACMKTPTYLRWLAHACSARMRLWHAASICNQL